MSIFISYSHHDTKLAMKIKTTLEEKGIPSYLAIVDSQAGDSVKEKIRENLEKSTEVFLLVSPYSLKSEWVISEFGASWALKKRIIPILYQCSPNDLPTIFSDSHCKDFHELDQIIYEYEERERIRNPNPADIPLVSSPKLRNYLTDSYIELSILSIFNDLPLDSNGLRIGDVQSVLGVNNRKPVACTIRKFEKSRLVRKTKSKNGTYWNMSSMGRQVWHEMVAGVNTRIKIIN